LYEWNGIKKLYAHIIRQIENGVATWKHDFSEVETPLLMKYVKSEQKSKIREKRAFSSTNSFLINDGKNTSARGLSLLEHCLNKADFEPLFLYTFSHAP
jgi:hypothetical protein